MIYDGNNLTGKEKFQKDDIIEYGYSGTIKELFLGDKVKADLLLEVWGAQGGSIYWDSRMIGGLGGYSKGEYHLFQEKIFICVGQQGVGRNPPIPASYNGGGSVNTGLGPGDHQSASGGGASHISFVNGTIDQLQKNDLLIVAGGGGGAYSHNERAYSWAGGSGGGLTGGDPYRIGGGGGYPGNGGTQTSGGTYNGKFGIGGTPPEGSHGSAGGGGLYGGGGSRGNTGGNGNSGGGGGSGYLSDNLWNALTTNGEKTGNGFIKITILDIKSFDLLNSNIYKNINNNEVMFDYSYILGE